mmetsp:Transcript_98760/g.175831  ORF Transcript_98760/g.175831 Transcript_98760/m.175831 type:complete len:609 (+) Transcript_98760:25-1851(+)
MSTSRVRSRLHAALAQAQGEQLETTRIQALSSQLGRPSKQERLNAAVSLGSLAKHGPKAALVGAIAGRALAEKSRDKEVEVRTSALTTLQAVAAAPDISCLFGCIPSVARSLQDDEVVNQRKAACICQAVVQGGGGTSVLPFQDLLLACFQKKGIIAALEALTSLVEAGHGPALMGAGSEIAAGIGNANGRDAALAGRCGFVGAFASTQHGDALLRAGMRVQVFEELTRLTTSSDRGTQLAAAVALRNFVEFNERCSRAIKDNVVIQKQLTEKLKGMSETSGQLFQTLEAICGPLETEPSGIFEGASTCTKDGGTLHVASEAPCSLSLQLEDSSEKSTPHPMHDLELCAVNPGVTNQAKVYAKDLASVSVQRRLAAAKGLRMMIDTKAAAAATALHCQKLGNLVNDRNEVRKEAFRVLCAVADHGKFQAFSNCLPDILQSLEHEDAGVRHCSEVLCQSLVRNGLSVLLLSSIAAILRSAGSSVSQETLTVALEILGDPSLTAAEMNDIIDFFFQSGKLLDAAAAALAEFSCEATLLRRFRAAEQLAQAKVARTWEVRKKFFRVKSFALGLKTMGRMSSPVRKLAADSLAGTSGLPFGVLGLIAGYAFS